MPETNFPLYRSIWNGSICACYISTKLTGHITFISSVFYPICAIKVVYVMNSPLLPSEEIMSDKLHSISNFLRLHLDSRIPRLDAASRCVSAPKTATPAWLLLRILAIKVHTFFEHSDWQRLLETAGRNTTLVVLTYYE